MGWWVPCQSVKRARLCSDPLLLCLPRHFHPPQKSTPVEFPLTGPVNALNMQLTNTEGKRGKETCGSFSVPLLEIGLNVSQISDSYLVRGICFIWEVKTPRGLLREKRPLWRSCWMCVFILLSGKPSGPVNDLCHSWGHQPHGQENPVLCLSQLTGVISSRGRDRVNRTQYPTKVAHTVTSYFHSQIHCMDNGGTNWCHILWMKWSVFSVVLFKSSDHLTRIRCEYIHTHTFHNIQTTTCLSKCNQLIDVSVSIEVCQHIDTRKTRKSYDCNLT